ncbi:hypothetical protein F511_20500 [Dorcoceras hygrometricum]|uniref:Uncharacterized protein n=1 Tax=Dorcoceras hygrometricum TaxID=472368 RepID=A0A2Z7ADA9_9LAMI|nr:hypothetical protein F511_20500 [Dorcoceras hygrometricum]
MRPTADVAPLDVVARSEGVLAAAGCRIGLLQLYQSNFLVDNLPVEEEGET